MNPGVASSILVAQPQNPTFYYTFEVTVKKILVLSVMVIVGMFALAGGVTAAASGSLPVATFSDGD